VRKGTAEDIRRDTAALHNDTIAVSQRPLYIPKLGLYKTQQRKQQLASVPQVFSQDSSDALQHEEAAEKALARKPWVSGKHIFRYAQASSYRN
jgi:hypothetical protein